MYSNQSIDKISCHSLKFYDFFVYKKKNPYIHYIGGLLTIYILIIFMIIFSKLYIETIDLDCGINS